MTSVLSMKQELSDLERKMILVTLISPISGQTIFKLLANSATLLNVEADAMKKERVKINLSK